MDGVVTSYLQLFRNGAVEAVETRMLEPDGHGQVIPGGVLVHQLVERLPLYVEALRERGADLPLVAFLTLDGVCGYRLDCGPRSLYRGGAPVDRNTLQLPEIILEDWQTPIPEALRPALDALWNAAGWARCTFYNPDGAYQVPR